MNKAVWLVALVAACGPSKVSDLRWEAPPAPPEPSASVGHAEPGPEAPQTFADYREALIDELLAADPGWGRSVGLHRYDGLLSDYSKAGVDKHIARLRTALEAD
jgi:hypothetical protein